MIAGFHQHKTQTRKPKPEQSPAARLTKPKTSLQLESKLQIQRIIRISRILNHPVDDHCQHFLLARLSLHQAVCLFLIHCYQMHILICLKQVLFRIKICRTETKFIITFVIQPLSTPISCSILLKIQVC